MIAPRLLLALSLLFAPAISSVVHAAEDPNARDEFGLKPDDGTDKDLSLPDPMLDRNWPGPKPGEGTHHPAVEPDEDETDPFQDRDAPPPPVKKDLPGSEAPGARPAAKPRPLVGPDGKLDAGSPQGEPDPIPPDIDEPDIDEPEIDEPSEIDDEDREPSPLDKDDAEFNDEMKDPGEW